jgi:hypothetical protein
MVPGVDQQRTDHNDSRSPLVDSALTLSDRADGDKSVPRSHSAAIDVPPSLSSLLVYTQTTSSHL